MPAVYEIQYWALNHYKNEEGISPAVLLFLFGKEKQGHTQKELGVKLGEEQAGRYLW